MDKKGFTLVELVVVIAVLAILAAIAIPIVIGVTNKANAATDVANAQAYEHAFKIAVAELELDEKDRLPAYKRLTHGTLMAFEALKLGGINNYGDFKPKQSGFTFYFEQSTSQVICIKTTDTPPGNFKPLDSTTKVTDGIV